MTTQATMIKDNLSATCTHPADADGVDVKQDEVQQRNEQVKQSNKHYK